MGELIAKCPVDGNDVFPDMSVLTAGPPYIVRCPSCGESHEWLLHASALVSIDARASDEPCPAGLQSND
jgi:hypothetical protein